MPPRSPSDDLHAQSRRRARLAAACGVSAGCLMVWGSLVALNQWVLGFDAWPQNDAPRAQQLVVPDAPRAQVGGRVTAVAAVPVAGRLGLFTGGAPAVLPATERVALTVAGRRRTAALDLPARTGAPGGVVAPGNGGAVAGGSADPDGDGIPTAAEIRRGTNPASADTDNDGAPDGWELKHGLNPRDFRDGAADSDGDGVKNVTEFRLGDNPNKAASRDGVPDGSRDTNGDGVSDATQVEQGTDPSAPAAPAEPQEPAPAPVEPAPPAEQPAPAPDPAPAPPESTPQEPAPAPAVQPDPAPAPAPEPAPAPDPPADPAPPPAIDGTGGVSAPDEPPVATDQRSADPAADAAAPAG